MKYLFSGLSLLGLLAGCGRSSDVSPVGSGRAEWVRQDFENLFGWINPANAASLSTERAHSGRYSLKTGPDVEYSVGFNVLMGKLSATKPRKIHVEAWAWVPSEKSTTVLVIQIANATKTVMWEGITLSSKVSSYKEWSKVEADVMLSPDITYEDGLSVYLWRQNETEPVYLDDLVISEAK
ncbi:hypothetical protein [Hymenobacter tenuis]